MQNFCNQYKKLSSKFEIDPYITKHCINNQTLNDTNEKAFTVLPFI